VHFAIVTEETAVVSETFELLAAFEGALIGSIVLVLMPSAKCQYIIMKAMETGGLTATRIYDQRLNLVRNNPGVHRPFYHPCSVEVLWRVRGFGPSAICCRQVTRHH
jgi:hypothetical protein